MKLRNLIGAVAVAATAAFSGTTASAATINLGFSLDESGSVGTTNFNTTRDALAAALATIPTSGTNQYRVAVTAFGSSVRTIVAPTIVTAANIASIQASVQAISTRRGFSTQTDDAITQLTSLFQPFSSDTTVFNITTDGTPSSQTDTEAAALASFNNYVDGISFEAVGSGVNSSSALERMRRIAGLGTAGNAANGVIESDLNNIPDATTTGFVIPVSTFAGYQAAINAKIEQVVIDTGGGGGTSVVPLPAGLPLLLAGLAGFGIMRRKQMAA